MVGSLEVSLVRRLWQERWNSERVVSLFPRPCDERWMSYDPLFDDSNIVYIAKNTFV